MRYCMIVIILGFPEVTNSFWPAPYKVDLHDRKTFVISAGEDDEGKDESEIEMIGLKDIEDIVDLAGDEERYQPLHSHVEHYNRRAAEAAQKYSLYFPESQLIFEETNLAENEKPFIAGYKHDLDKYVFETALESPSHIISELEVNNSKPLVTGNRPKRDENENDILGSYEHSDDLVESMSPRNKTMEEDEHENTQVSEEASATTERMEEYEDDKTSSENGASSQGPEKNGKKTTPSDEVNETEIGIYDYESLRAEYDQQIADAIKSNLTYNYTGTDQPEETVKDAIKKIVDFDKPKNCTEEELSKFGAKAFACLAYDYRNAKNKTEARKIVARTWNVVKIWLCIYACIAVPAWCQKGWCCCCFRCSFCFPNERISAAKNYYADNEPGTLVEQPSKSGEETKPIKYKPTLFEIDAYEELESAIRNL